MTRALSPIERMIDEACGYEPDTPKPITADEMGKLIASRVLDHIDYAYPHMWEGVAKNARRSIHGCIRNAAIEFAPRLERK